MLTSEFATDRDELQSVESCVTSLQTSLTIPSEFEWMDQVVRYLQQRTTELAGCDEATGMRISVALHEALTNAIVHGNLEISSELKEEGGSQFAEALAMRSADEFYAARRVAIRFDFQDNCCRWVITDEGQGFDVARISKRAEDNVLSFAASGRGLIMMRAFMDDVRYELGGRRCIMTLNCGDDTNCRMVFPAIDGDDPKLVSRNHVSAFAIGQSVEVSHRGPFDGLMDPFLSSLLKESGEKQEKRKHRRLPFTERLVLAESGHEDRVAFARNISSGGISFIANFAIESKQIGLTIPREDGDMHATGEIVRSTQTATGIFDYGVEFHTLERC